MSRAQASLAVLTATTILTAGLAAQALAAPAGTAAGILLLTSGTAFVLSAVLLGRVLRHLSRGVPPRGRNRDSG